MQRAKGEECEPILLGCIKPTAGGGRDQLQPGTANLRHRQGDGSLSSPLCLDHFWGTV